MKITASQIRNTIKQLLKEQTAEQQELQRLVDGLNPMLDVAITKLSNGDMVKVFIPGAYHIKIADIAYAPRKWVLMTRTSDGRDWRAAYYEPYVAVKTGTWRPREYALTIDPVIDKKAAKHVGGQ